MATALRGRHRDGAGMTAPHTPGAPDTPSSSHLMGRCFSALAIFAALMASTTPSPLYPVYIREWALPQSAGTTIFATYAIGTLLALFLSGWLNGKVRDHRAILLPALLLGAAGALVLATAGNVGMLIIGRFLAGMATGLITSTASGALFVLDRPDKRGRAAVISTVAFTAGAATGPVVSTVALDAGLWPLVLPYLCIAATCALAFAGLALSPWKARLPATEAREAAENSAAPRGPVLLLACLSVVTAWMLGSMLMALAVGFAGGVFNLNLVAVAGLLPALFQLSAGIGQVLSGRLPALRAILLGGTVLVLLQMAVALAAADGLSWAYVLWIPLCGLAYGACFVGGAALVNQRAPSEKLARWISVFYVSGYLSNALPSFGMGFLVDAIGMKPAFLWFSLAEVLVGVLTVLLALRVRAQDRRL